MLQAVKPTSIVFLVIAALLIVGGMITCSVAKDIALTDNYTLFHEMEDGSTYIRYDFTAANISKIELLITDAEINIISGAEESFIEFINFREGLYTLSTSGKVISMDEIPDLKSIFSLQSGFSFSGMRYILRSGTLDLGEKKVNIHLSADSALKILAVEAENCVLKAENVSYPFDIQITANECAAIEASELRTSCALDIRAAKTDLQLQRCNFNNMEINASSAEIGADHLYWEHLTLDIDSGNVQITSAAALSADRISVTGSGSFILGGTEMDMPHRAEAAEFLTNTVTASIGWADLRLDMPDEPTID